MRWMLCGCVVLLGCAQESAGRFLSDEAVEEDRKVEHALESVPRPASGPAAAPVQSIAMAKATDASLAGAARLVIREAQLRLRSRDPRAVADEAMRIAASAGGFVLTSEARTIEGTTHELVLHLRVPEASLDAVMGELRRLGTVLQEAVTGQDVTEEFVDVSARLKTERVLEQRLLGLLESSAALNDLLKVEQELARVRGEIERKEARVRYLGERARMASIQLYALAPNQPAVARVDSLGSRLSNAVREAFDVSFSVVEFAIVAVGFVLPLAVGVLVTLTPIVWLRRRRALVAGVQR